jgi:lipopolysaccharide/colanic/teichoic acid biosynthesis glycosyltransferase
MVQKSLTYECSKKLFDIFLSIFAILMLSPFFIIIAITVKATSPGDVFYRGVRTGIHGKIFKIFKFRSMYTGSDKGPGTTSKADARITYVGAYLRKYKLDELPQLFNILFGDMSFVGPRPELKSYTDLYKGDEKLILTVRPGLTDFSSLYFSNLNELIDDKNPDRVFEKTILPKKNRLRIEYVKKRNFLLDLKLILKTFIKVVGFK